MFHVRIRGPRGRHVYLAGSRRMLAISRRPGYQHSTGSGVTFRLFRLGGTAAILVQTFTKGA